MIKIQMIILHITVNKVEKKFQETQDPSIIISICKQDAPEVIKRGSMKNKLNVWKSPRKWQVSTLQQSDKEEIPEIIYYPKNWNRPIFL